MVERVLALVVRTDGRFARTGAADGVNLVDEDDGGGFLLGLAEEVAHTAGTYADKHLDEVRARQGEEGHARFACHGFGQERLARARRANEESTLGNLAAQFGIFGRILEEIHNLLDLLLRAFLSGHVLEGNVRAFALFDEAGFALADREDATAATAAAHPAEEEEPEANEQERGQDEGEEVVEVVGLFGIGDVHAGHALHETFQFVQTTVASAHGGVLAHLLDRALEDGAHLIGVDGEVGCAGVFLNLYLGASVLGDVFLKFRVGHLLIISRGGERIVEDEEAEDKDDGHIYPGEIHARLFVFVDVLLFVHKRISLGQESE